MRQSKKESLKSLAASARDAMRSLNAAYIAANGCNLREFVILQYERQDIMDDLRCCMYQINCVLEDWDALKLGSGHDVLYARLDNIYAEIMSYTPVYAPRELKDYSSRPAKGDSSHALYDNQTRYAVTGVTFGKPFWGGNGIGAYR